MKILMLKLKGSMRVSHFTLEVDLDFKSTREVKNFIDWAERLRNFHPPQKDS